MERDWYQEALERKWRDEEIAYQIKQWAKLLFKVAIVVSLIVIAWRGRG